MSRTTIDLEHQEKREPEFLAALPQTAQRGLIALQKAELVSTTSPGPLSTTPSRRLVAHTTQHTRCRCPRCRKRRTRKRAARMNPQNAPFIEATIITVTPWVDERPGGQGYTPTSSGPGTHSQPSWSAQQPGAASPRRRFSPWQVCLAIAVLLALVWVSGLGDQMAAYLFPNPSATITIIPSSSKESLSISITAALGPDGANQVAARILQGSSPLRTVVALATGSGQTPAQASQGTLIFYNQGPSPQTIGAGTSLTGADGIEVETLASVTVPAGNPPALGLASVGAQSVQAGSRANIAAGDITGLCCAAGISAKNSAFSGGQDAQTYPVLEQHDIERASATVAQALIQQAQRQLQGRVSSSEQLALGPQCHTSVAAASPAGSHVPQATISVSAACTGEAFDRVGALSLAASLYARAAAKQLGPPYSLASRVTTTIAQAGLADARRGTLTVTVQAQGTWRYQWSRAERQAIARRIQGKSVSVALSLLAQAPGVAHTSISLEGGAQNIPTDAARITIVILPVPGGPAR